MHTFDIKYRKLKTPILFVMVLFATLSAGAQEIVTDTVKGLTENDSIFFSMEMDEVVISNVKDTLTPDEKKQLLILRRRVLKVYPYAKIAADRLTLLNRNMEKLKSEREKKKYAKIVQKYLEEEFEGQLKKLSRKDGQILVKLIHRQTGETTYNLIKEQKSGFKAFWSDKMARMFDINLKTKYDPANVAEDYLIEGFLLKAFDEYRLQRQEPALDIDYEAITANWRARNKA